MNDKFYKNKYICIIGSGKSSEKFDINFDKYDEVIGFNRIYNTKYKDNITILYDGLSKHIDTDTLIQGISTCKNLKKILLVPTSDSKYYLDKAKKVMLELNCKLEYILINNNSRLKSNTKILTGVSIFIHILSKNPKHIDIYGFDFYEQDYIDGISKLENLKVHNMVENKKLYISYINKYNNKVTHFI